MIGDLFTPEKLKTILEHKAVEIAIIAAAFALLYYLKR